MTLSPSLSLAFALAMFLQSCVRSGGPGAEPLKLEMPLGLPATSFHVPKDNPLTADKIELGRRLFFDKRLSQDGSISCATCHDPLLGFTNGQPAAEGVSGLKTSRSAPTIINRAFGKSQLWDGKITGLEAQVIAAIADPQQMGDAAGRVANVLGKDSEYQQRFDRVFGAKVNVADVAKAIAAFERTLVSGNSLYDQFKAGNKDALSEAAQRGLALFESPRANCAACHGGPNFTDESFANTGVGFDSQNSDPGRYAVTKNDSDRGAFKTPTLRDIVRTAPYMHDGSLRTLKDVIEFYDRGGIPNTYQSKKIKPLRLTAGEKADLLAFLKSLGGRNIWTFL